VHLYKLIGGRERGDKSNLSVVTYSFPGSSTDRIALVLNSWGFITPAQASTTYLDSARRRERLKNLSGRECLFRRGRRCANARLPL